MHWLILAGGVVAAYLLGSINTSVVVCRLAGKGDVRQVGSGNPGATNTLRLLGKGWALVVLGVDAGRGAGVYLLAAWLLPGPWQPFAVSLGVVLGNLFPVFHRFHGGKGVATSLGLYLAIDPVSGLLGIGIWLLVVVLTRLASLGSLTMVACYPGLLALRGLGLGAIGFGCLLIALLAFTHRQNIGRLIRGQEHRIGLGKGQSTT